MAQSFSLEEALGGASESTSTPAVGFSLEEALGVPAAPEAPVVPGPTPGLVSLINKRPAQTQERQAGFMLRPEFVEEVRNSFAELPPEQRRAALEQEAAGSGVRAQAAQRILDEVRAQDRRQREVNLGREKMVELLANAPKKPVFGIGAGAGKTQFPDVTPTFLEQMERVPEKERIQKRLALDEASRAVTAAATSPEAIRERDEIGRSLFDQAKLSLMEVGVPQAQAGGMAMNLVAQQGQIDKANAKLAELESYGLGDSEEAAGLRKTIDFYTQRQQTYMKDLAQKQQELSVAPTYRGVRQLSESKSFKEGLDVFANDPVAIVANLAAQSLPTSIPGLVLGVINPALGAAAMGGSSLGVEFGSSLMEFAQDKGFDTSDPEQMAAFFADKELLREGINKAGKRAGIVAAGDMFLAGLASKTMVPKRITSPVAKNVANMVAQMGAQGIGGGGFEAAAQIATEGAITKPGEVLAEFLGEFGGAPAEVYAQTRQTAREIDRQRAIDRLQAFREQQTKAPVLSDEDRQLLVDHAKDRLAELTRRAEGTEEQIITTPDGKRVKIPARPKEFLSPEDKDELAFLQKHSNNPEMLDRLYEISRPEPKTETETFTVEDAIGSPQKTQPLSPAVQRMQEQQRAAAELEAAPEAPAEPTDPQERYKNLTGRMAKITELFRENAITNAEYEDFKRQLEEARQAAQAAPTEGLSEAKQEILRLAGQIEALGQKDFAEGMRLRARPNSPEPRSSDMQYYQQRAAELQFAKAPKEEAAAPETYGLQQFFADDQKEIDRLTQQLAGRGRIKFALQETNDAIQSLHDTIRNAGFTLNQQEVPDGIKKLKNQIGILAAGASRLSKAQEAIDKGYKRADRKRVESDLDQLRSDIDASYELTAVEPKRPTAAEEMEGVEVPFGEEIAGLAEQQRKAAEDRGILSRRTAGTSLMKVLQGTLRDGELSELAGRARQVGKNPFLNLKAPKGQLGSSMEDMVNSGVLDAFLPDAMRPGAETYDNAEAAEYIREKLRNNEFYTYETELAIERIDRDIEAIERQIQELLTIEDINKEIQRATDEQRELDQAAAEPAPEEEAGAAEERAGEEEVLKAQTEEELRAKAKREEEAARKEEESRREEERKAAAPKAEEFVLTGSERAADQAAARGQMELAPAEEAKQPDMEAPLSAENEAALPDYLKAAKDGPDAGEYRFRRLVQLATERGTPINVWSTKDGLVTLAEGVEQPKYARLVAFIQPETKERPSNMYKALEQQGFKRLDKNDERVYRDQGGKAYPTFEKNGARIAMTSNNILYENDKGDVEIGYGEPEDTVVHALLVDPATRGQGVASKVMDELGALADEYGVTLYLEPTAISDKPVPTMKLVQFYEGKGYEFDGDSSKVMVRQPGGQTFLNIEPVGESVAGDASTRAPSLKRKVKTLNKQREQGKISGERFVNEVDWAVKQDEERRTKVVPRERVRGADFIRQKLLEAKRRGDLSAEGVDLAEWFIQQNEALVDDLGIAIKTPKQGGTAGMYNKLARIMVLMKEASNDATVVHEILHHLERMMPAEVQAAIRKEWLGSMLRASREAKSPQEKLFFAALINHHFGSGFTSDITIQGADAGKVLDDLIKRGVVEGPRASSQQLAIEMIRNGMVPYDRYQYVNPSEFWAVRGSDIVQGRFKAIKGGVLEKLKNWLKELGQKIKSIFGLRSDAPLIKALDSLAKGDGKFVSKDMLVEGEDFLQVGKNIYGRTPLVAWTKPDETKLDDFIYKMQDKLIDTKRVIQGIEQSIGKIDDKWNPYLQEELFHGRTATETKQFRAGEVRPLLEQMQKEGVTIGELEEYLHNRFAPVRNENIARINPLMPDGGSGIDTADAKAYMAALTPEQKAKYEKLAARVDAITNGTRQYLVASGLEDAETIEEWEKSSPGYVPLNREDVEYSNPVGTGTGRGFSVKGPSSRRATGSERKVVNILSNLISQRESAIVRGEKNRVATALYGLAMQNPNPEYWLAVNPDAAQSRKKVTEELVNMGLSPADAEGIMKEPTQKVVDSQTGMVATRINPVLRNANNVLGVRINGKDRFVFFNTQNDRAARMANALLNLDADQLGTIMSTMAAVTRYFASINTQYNPVFGLYNFLRDLQGGAIQLSNTPIADKRAEVLSPKNLAGALNGIYQTLRADRKRGQQLMTPWADLWIEFQREGGQTGYRDMFSRSQERANALQNELNRLSESKGKKAALAVPRAVFEWLADYNETLENAVRLTAYKAALDKGMSKEQAASVAKNLTVNFNRKGQIGVQAGALYAFFNSSVQGTARLLQTVVRMDRPGDIKSLHLTKAGKTIVYGGLLLGVAQAMMMAAMGFDDEEPPDFVKDRNLIIPLPDGKYLAWPMPLGYHVIPAFSRILTEWAISGGKDSGKRIAHLASLLLDAFSPIGNAGLSVQSIAPTIFDPIVALFENKDWTGKKIAKEDFNKLDPTPGYTRAKQNASWIGKQLSYYLNLASGGDKDKPGIVSPTPDQIDYLIGQATGGVGREVMKATKTAEAMRTGEELAPYNIPIVGRFYGDTKAGYAESSRFYKNLEEINILENQYKGRQKRQEGTADFVKENPKVRLAEAAHQVERNVQRLRKQRDQLIEKGAPKEQIKAIENRMTLQMKRLNEKAAQMEK